MKLRINRDFSVVGKRTTGFFSVLIQESIRILNIFMGGGGLHNRWKEVLRVRH